MICDEYKFVRIHIKKCGGRSFCLLYPKLPDTHETIREYETKFSNKLREYYKWTVVRNPWERLVSLFFYSHQETNFHGHKNKYHKFKDFIADLYFSSRYASTVFHLGKWPFESMPQLDYLKDSKGMINLDHICYLPRIHDDFEIVKKACGFPSEWKYPHFGKSNHNDYRTYYDDFTTACVGYLYSDEIEYFGFDFEDRNKFKF